MTKKLNTYNLSQSKKDLPNIRSGDTVKISQKIKEGDKERIQDFIGLVIARKHGNELGGTITVRKIICKFVILPLIFVMLNLFQHLGLFRDCFGVVSQLFKTLQG